MTRGSLGRGRSGRARDDRGKIYLAKTVRAVAYGALSGFLLLYLVDDLHFEFPFVPNATLSSLVVASFSLVGAAVWSLVALPRIEPRLGRRRTLLFFGALFVASAVLLYLASDPWLVLAAVLLGGVGATSADNGPLASLDQATLPATLRSVDRAEGFAWYNLLAYVASAGGALLLVVPGSLAPRAVPFLPPAPHPWILLVYILLAGSTDFAYAGLSADVEEATTPDPASPRRLTGESRGLVRDLAALFAVDAFAGGFVINPLIAGYFVLAWHADSAEIGSILFVTGLVAAGSFLLASALARRFGLLRTMVFSHIPSNVLLVLVPLMPTFPLALAALVARSSLSQMDVPTRQAYSMALVRPKDRTAAAGTLAGARGIGQSLGPFPGAAFEAAGLLALPFVLGGSIKVAYDLAVWQRFRRVPVPDDGDAPTSSAGRRPG
ncbi:MAG TPA: MFS transporter [Thermoplasmata archaeon]|nr:MFS transporter [Thermoplasmata archaeon]